MKRGVALAQIVIVVLGVYVTIAILDRLGIGMGGPRFPGSLGLVLHVVLVALISVSLALLTLREDRVAALGLGRRPISRIAFWVLLGGMGTFLVNALVVLVYVTIRGGLSSEMHEAKAKAAAFSTLSQTPLYVMLPIAVLAGLYEEIVFRGFLLGRLRILVATKKAWLGDALAIAISSIVFGLGHAYQGALGVMQTMFAGMCLAILAVLSKSLWPSIITHAGIDVTSLVILHVIGPYMDKAIKSLPASP